MRTRVTLNPELAARLRALARERGVSFEEALNSTLQRGLTTGSRSARRYRLASRRLGLRPWAELEHALPLASELEDAETIRKLVPRK
jgi:hypothetical protein